MDLKPGLRFLDLRCGNSASSIFLAEQYDLYVVALDSGADPTANWLRVKEAGLKDLSPI